MTNAHDPNPSAKARDARLETKKRSIWAEPDFVEMDLTTAELGGTI